MRRPILFLALASAACRLIVGFDDHHLRDDDPASDATVTDASAPEIIAPDVSVSAEAAAPPYTVSVVASGRVGPRAMVLNHLNGVQYIFWVEAPPDGGDGAVMRVADAPNSVPEKLSPAVNPRAIRLDSVPGLFVTDDDRPTAKLRHVYPAPGGTNQIWDQDGVRGFGSLAVLTTIPSIAYSEALDPNDGGAHIRRTVHDDAGVPVDCFAYNAPSPTHFTAINVDVSHVFFGDDSSGALMRMNNGCDQAATVFAPNQHVVALTYDLTNLYWLTSDGYARYMKKNGTGDVTTWNVRLLTPGGIADDNAGNVYFTDAQLGIVYGSIQQTDPVVVASQQGGPYAIGASTVTGQIYWLNRNSGEVMKATR